MAFYRLSERSIIPGEWGDYGDILEHGMTAHRSRQNDSLRLERTGPYISPITFPGLGDIVLTSAARATLERSGLTGFSFRPVLKKLIVELHWERWDLTASEPAVYPNTGEPEDYLLGGPHSPEAAAVLGDLWELVTNHHVRVNRPQGEYVVQSNKELWIDLSTWDGADVFRSKDVLYTFVTERGRECFLDSFDRYVAFEEFQSA